MIQFNSIKETIKKYRKYFSIIKVLITVLVFYILFKKINFSEISENIKHFNLNYLLLNFFLGIGIGQFLIIIRLYLCLRANQVNCEFMKLTKYHFISLFFQNLLPTGIGSDAVKLYYLRNTTRFSKLSYLIFLVRLSGFISLFILFIFTTLFFKVDYSSIHLPFSVYWFKYFCIICIIAFFGFFIIKPFTNLKNRSVSKHKVVLFLSKLEQIFTARLFLLTIFYSICIHIVSILIFYFFFLGLNIPVSLLDLFIYFPFILLMIFIIPSMNGMGVREYLLYYFFKQEIGSIENMFIISMAIIVMYLVMSLFGGGVYLYKKIQDYKK